MHELMGLPHITTIALDMFDKSPACVDFPDDFNENPRSEIPNEHFTLSGGVPRIRRMGVLATSDDFIELMKKALATKEPTIRLRIELTAAGIAACVAAAPPDRQDAGEGVGAQTAGDSRRRRQVNEIHDHYISYVQDPFH